MDLFLTLEDLMQNDDPVTLFPVSKLASNLSLKFNLPSSSSSSIKTNQKQINFIELAQVTFSPNLLSGSTQKCVCAEYVLALQSVERNVSVRGPPDLRNPTNQTMTLRAA